MDCGPIIILNLLMQNPKIVSIHCVAHRLALAVAGAAKSHMPINMCLTQLDRIHSYFSKSAVRTSAFVEIQVKLSYALILQFIIISYCDTFVYWIYVLYQGIP